MMAAYTFFDVETPNKRHDCICSIGVERTDDRGRIEYSRHFYVNPEQGFDEQNISVHGISPAQVKNEPTFAELWQSELSQVITDSVLVAHNASFDMSVLGKTLDVYGLFKPEVSFIDTVDIARHLLNLDNYGLSDVCAYYDVELLNHHNALSDAHACDEIYWAMVNEYPQLYGYLGNRWLWRSYDPRSSKATCCDQVLTDLYGITLGIAADKVIRPQEMRSLHEWMARNEQYKNTAFICDAFELLEEALSDGVVTQSEHERILNLTRPFVLNGHNKAETVSMQELIGILRGISCDGIINECEAIALREWLESNHLDKHPNAATLCTELDKALADGSIDIDEESGLLDLCERIINPVSSVAHSDALDGGSEDGNDIVFQGCIFVLTGNFSHGSKGDVAAFIEKRGGKVVGSVSGKVSYVVVGGEGSESYACGTYGTKVQKAMELQEKGKPIKVILEEQLGM